MESPSARRLLPLVLAAALGIAWVAGFEPFTFPNNDYYSLERAAWSLGNGELPTSLKRGPLLPGLMALTAPLLARVPPLGGAHPELRAALLWNLLFSVGLVLALARFAGRTFPDAAPAFLLLLATTPVLHASALQPLVEPNLAFFVAAAFVGLRARSAWQYLAAAGAALARPEAAALAAVLALVNGVAERRPLRHTLLALAALAPFLLWNALGAARGSGAATYLDLMQNVAPRGVALVAVHYLREGFAGWSSVPPGAVGLALGGLLVLLFGAQGFRVGLRGWRREAFAMALFLGASVAAVALFGISKSRYVAPTVWIALAFVAVGVCDFAVGLARAPRARGAIAAALLVPLLAGGLLRTRTLLTQVRDLDRGVLPAARWLEANLTPDDIVALTDTSQVLWITDLASYQVRAWGTFDAGTPEELREEMRAEGVTYAAWTWRRPATTPSQRFYDERKRIALRDVFRDGAPVEGFELVATLPAPEGLEQEPARIYRLRDPLRPPSPVGAPPAD